MMIVKQVSKKRSLSANEIRDAQYTLFQSINQVHWLRIKIVILGFENI